MKLLKLSLLVLCAGLTSLAVAQTNGVNIDELVLAVREDPENAAEMVESVVADSPDQAQAVVNRLLAEFPELAEEVIFGAVNGLSDPLSEEAVSALVTRSVLFRPALANAIVAGATRAAPEFEAVIIAAARSGLRDGLGVIGRTGAPSAPPEPEGSVLFRVISPASN